MEINFCLEGDPEAKERPRVYLKQTKNGVVSRSYTPKKTSDWENMLALEYSHTISHYWEKDIPLEIEIIAKFKIPKRYTKKQRELINQGIIVPTKKDWDNIGKIITDALNKVAYDDDRYIICGKVVKIYTLEKPSINICIRDAKNYFELYNKRSSDYEIHK